MEFKIIEFRFFTDSHGNPLRSARLCRQKLHPGRPCSAHAEPADPARQVLRVGGPHSPAFRREAPAHKQPAPRVPQACRPPVGVRLRNASRRLCRVAAARGVLRLERQGANPDPRARPPLQGGALYGGDVPPLPQELAHLSVHRIRRSRALQAHGELRALQAFRSLRAAIPPRHCGQRP